MVQKMIGLAATAGVWTVAAVAFPPVLVVAAGVRVVTAPSMRRFVAQYDAPPVFRTHLERTAA